MGLLEDLDLSSIQDENARRCLVLLLNLVEDIQRENLQLRTENQRLRDEINRLKGEQGKPTIKANTPPPTNYSSERQRHTPKEWAKRKKSGTIRIDREQVLAVDPTTLPADAQFKGHEDVVVQDIVFGTANVLFHKQKFYSPGEGRTYLAALPGGYEGQFGPGIKALSIVLYYGANVSEPKILALFRSAGMVISAGALSNLLIKDQDAFHADTAAVHAAGLASSAWQHLDETSTRVNGQNHYCQVMQSALHELSHDSGQRSAEYPRRAAHRAPPAVPAQCRGRPSARWSAIKDDPPADDEAAAGAGAGRGDDTVFAGGASAKRGAAAAQMAAGCDGGRGLPRRDAVPGDQTADL